MRHTQLLDSGMDMRETCGPLCDDVFDVAQWQRLESLPNTEISSEDRAILAIAGFVCFISLLDGTFPQAKASLQEEHVVLRIVQGSEANESQRREKESALRGKQYSLSPGSNFATPASLDGTKEREGSP